MDLKQKLSEKILKNYYTIELPSLRPTMFHYNFVIFSVVFILSLVGLSIYIDAPTGLDVAGKLVLENPAIPVKALKPIIVYRNQLVENQIVVPGQVLLTSTFGMKIQTLDSIQQIIAELEKAFKAKEECLSCVLNFAASIESLRNNSDIQTHQEFLGLASYNSNLIQRTAENLQKTSKTMRTVFAKLEIAEKNKKKRAIASDQKNSEGTSAADHPRLLEDYKQLNNAYTFDRGVYKTEIEKLMSLTALARAKLNALEKTESVTAPFGGKITNVKVKGTGEFINPGQMLFELVPEANDLIVQLEIPNKDISLFKVGESVEVAIDAFPEYDYGRVSAKLIKILEPESTENTPQNMSKGFRAQALLKKQSLERNGKSHQLLNGMSLKARVHKEPESLFMSFLKTIFKFKQDLKT